MTGPLEGRVVVAWSPRDVGITTVQVDPPGPGEVRAEILRSGVCGSDLRVVNGTSRVAAYPLVLGHEGVGRVIDVGPNVMDLQPGDLVVTMPFAPCNACQACRVEEPLMCSGESRMRARAGLMADGTSRVHLAGEPLRTYLGVGSLADVCVVSDRQAYPVPAGMSADLLVDLTCGTLTGLGAAWGTSAVAQGRCAAVVGCGAVGRAVIQGARIAGVTSVVAFDLDPERLAAATEAGATATVHVPPVGRGEHLSDCEVDAAFEAAGTVAAFDVALAATGPRGTCVVVGGPPPGSILRVPSDVLFSGRTVVGAPNGNAVPAGTLARALELVRAGVYRPIPVADRAWVDIDDVVVGLLLGAAPVFAPVW